MLKRLKINTALGYVEEARLAARDWRAESWRDCEMYDGDQWTKDDLDMAIDYGIDPLTINRTFPAINLILGTQAVTRQNIIAKARTSKDGQMAEIMTEGIHFVLDQCQGQFKLSQAFRDSVIPGIGWVQVGLDPDPRHEPVRLVYRDWKEIWFDPFASPWVDPEDCRYMFYQKWVDLEVLIAMFPEKEKEIKHAYTGLCSQDGDYLGGYGDEADDVEQDKRVLGSASWVDPNRKRVRPVEMWYPMYEDCLFALFDNGQCVEIKKSMSAQEQFQLMSACSEVVKAKVRKMRTMTFLGKEILQDMPTPFGHDQYPYIPFLGYVDRLGCPYGVPRQIRGQNIEVNKRRSVALALLQKRRLLMEEGAAKDPQTVHEEMISMDGLVLLNPGGLGKVRVEEGQMLAQGQAQLMASSESEIQQITGVNNESMGYHSAVQSGRALENKQRQSNTVLATLFDNYRRSLFRVGTLVSSEIQDKWKGPKILRITDKMTNAERFVEVNQPKQTETGTVVIQNDITQGRYDVIVSDAPQTDTTREQSLNLIIEWVKQSPPEIIPQLMSFALELSNLPNKEALLMRLRPLLGIMPGEEDMSPEEIKEQIAVKMESEKKEGERKSQIEELLLQLEMEAKKLDNQSKALENEKLKAETADKLASAKKKESDAEREALQTEFKIAREVSEEVNKSRFV